MKISRSMLTAAGIGAAAQKAEQNQQERQPVVANKPLLNQPIKDITYDKAKANPEQPQAKGVLRQLCEEYAAKFGIKVVETLKDAIVGRANGERVLSPREADIIFRKEVDGSNEMLQSIFQEFSAFITEGDKYDSQNPWMLRYRYNRGVHWREHERQKATPAMQIEGDAKLEAIANQLAVEWGLPAHPPELRLGFHPELCRPEYLEPGQFAEGQAK